MDGSCISWLWKHIEKWRKPVQVAVQSRDVEKIVWLKKSGADFSVKTKDGESVLHLLAQSNEGLKINDDVIFDLLLSEHCLDVNATDINGMSALHLAAAHGNHTIALKLIKHGAKVNCKNKIMRTPLHYAVSMENPEVVYELLLSRGANVNAKDCKGVRPIHLSVHSKRIVDILVNYGAHVDVQDQAGQTPLAKSISYGYFSTAQILCLYGADVSNEFAALRTMTKFDIETLLILNLRSHITVTNHLAELMVADLLYANTFVCNTLKTNPDIFKNFRNRVHKLNREVVWLKRAHFDERTTIYDVLHMDSNERCRFICGRWEEWQDFCHHVQFDEHLSHFSDVFKACGYQARARSRLLKSAKDAWLKLTKISLPDLCVDRILSHLSNSELLRMVDEDES